MLFLTARENLLVVEDFSRRDKKKSAVLVKKLAPKGMSATRRSRVPPMPFGLSPAQLPDLVNTVPGVRAVRDLPMPKRRGLFFHAMFPAFWQLPLIRQFRGACTLLEFG